MPTIEVKNSGEGRGSGIAPASAPCRAYVVPKLSRYGTLAELTKASGGGKNFNDSGGPGAGCGQSNQFNMSCVFPSDARLKDDIVPLKRLNNGISLYSYRYRWSDQHFIGVMAQEVAKILPDAVLHGEDGYLRVDYARLGITLMPWKPWSRELDRSRTR